MADLYQFGHSKHGDGFLRIMGHTGFVSGTYWYLGTGYESKDIKYIGGSHNNFSVVTQIEGSIEQIGVDPFTSMIVVTDKTAIRLYLEGHLTEEILQDSVEIDGSLVVDLPFFGKVWEVWIKKSSELSAPFDFEDMPSDRIE